MIVLACLVLVPLILGAPDHLMHPRFASIAPAVSEEGSASYWVNKAQKSIAAQLKRIPNTSEFLLLQICRIYICWFNNYRCC